MNNTEGLVQRALNLYSFGPENAGLSLFVGGGPSETKSPTIEKGGAGELAAKSGLARKPADRPSLELCIFIDHKDEKFLCRIEKVTGVGFLDTIPDETVMVDQFEAASFDEIAPLLTTSLDKARGELELYLMRVFYRNGEFTKSTFARDRQATENPGRLNRWMGYADKELRQYVYDTFEKALSWGPSDAGPDEVSVWFTPDVEDKTGQIYVRIIKVEAGFAVSLEDRHCYPWVKKNTTVKEVFDIAGFVATYLSKKHQFAWKGAKAYFAYTLNS